MSIDRDSPESTLAEHAEVELLDMEQVKIEAQWALRIPANLAIRRQFLPFT